MNDLQNKRYLYNLCLEHNFFEVEQFHAENPDFNFNFTLENGNGLLHAVCENVSAHSLSLIKFLLDLGCDQFLVNENFITPYDIAKERFNSPALALFAFYRNKNDSQIIDILKSK